MLKKSLIAVAVLAIALPAMAGDTKVHVPWPMVYQKVPVTTIDVTLDVGYYIHVKDQKAIKVHQNSAAENPYQTYVGCRDNTIISNFNATVSGSVKSASDAGGSWKAFFNGESDLDIGPSTSGVPVQICVEGSGVDIGKLTGGDKDYKVATLTVLVVPTAVL